MTTKNLKLFDELNAEYFKLKKEKSEKAIADKLQKKTEDQALEDSGHKRVIISTTVREPEPVEVVPVKKAKKAKVESIPAPEVIEIKVHKIDPKDAEIERLKALLAEKENIE